MERLTNTGAVLRTVSNKGKEKDVRNSETTNTTPSTSLFTASSQNAAPTKINSCTEKEKIEISNGAYKGESNANGVAHGKGSYESANIRYIGGFNEGYYHGFGSLMIKATKDNLNGMFDNGVFVSGRFNVKDICTLEWAGLVGLDDNFNGEGEVRVKQGNAYYVLKCNFEEGEACGEGEYFGIGFHTRHYKGSYVAGVRHGKGRMLYLDGTVYDGDWVNGAAYGKGRMVCANGDYFDGIWKNGGFISGMVRQNLGIKGVYEGCYEHGKLYGQGKKTFLNGYYFIGFWDGDMLKEGSGKVLFKAGTYEGAFKDCKSDGKGKMVFNDGAFYEGDWADGVTYGDGKMVYVDGSMYIGKFIGGCKRVDGKGVFIGVNGVRQEGLFKNKLLNGKNCIIELDNVYRYEGDCVSSKPKGKGKLIVIGHGSYEGDFETDRLDGTMLVCRGKVIFDKDKKTYDGTFAFNIVQLVLDGMFDVKGKFIFNKIKFDIKLHVKDGNRVGEGKIIYPNGDMYEGNMQNEISYGQGKLYFALSKASLIGEFIDGFMYKGRIKSRDNKTIFEGEIYPRQQIQTAYNVIFNFKENTYIGVYEYADYRDGRGHLVCQNSGNVYSGQFVQGKLNDQDGGIRYAGGYCYKGGVKNNQPINLDELFWLDSMSEPKGEFINGQLNGSILIIDFQRQSIIKGVFENGELVGDPNNINIDDIIEIELKLMMGKGYIYNNEILEIVTDFSDPINFATLKGDKPASEYDGLAEENYSWCGVPNGLTVESNNEVDSQNMIYALYTTESLDTMFKKSDAGLFINPTTRYEFAEAQVLRGFDLLKWLLFLKLHGDKTVL